MGNEAQARNSMGRRAMMSVVAFVVILITMGLMRYHQSRFGVGEVTIGDTYRVAVEVAASDQTRERGLSDRSALASDTGMLFLFATPGKYGFWMKDMLFPIDVLWIRGNEIVDMTTEIQPPVTGQDIPRFTPLVPVDAVLELPAGYIASHGLRTGLPVTVRVDRKGGLR